MHAPRNRIKRFFTDTVNDALRKDENLEFVANELEKRIGTRAFKMDLEPQPFTARISPEGITGDYIRELRCCLGITKKKMAWLLKISPDILARVERGQYILDPRPALECCKIGEKFAIDGTVPQIKEPPRKFSGGGEPVGGRKRRRTVSVKDALKEPGFAAREFGIGMAIGGGILFGVLSLFLAIF